jgi:hypothetical protein
MKAILILSILFAGAFAQAQQWPLIDPDLPGLYRLNTADPEVEIKDDYIRRITIGAEKVVITFYNSTDRAWRPMIRIMILDKYGLPTRTATEYWIVNTIGPGETKSKESVFSKNRIAHDFTFSRLRFPGDLGEEELYVGIAYD